MSKLVKFREELPSGYIYWGEDLEFKRPVFDMGENKGTVTAIMNACKKSIVEQDLSIYISSEALKAILRTQANSKIRNIIANLDDEDKLDISNNNTTYIAFGEILKLLNKEIIEAVDDRKRMYLKIAEKSLINMRDCDKLRLLAIERDKQYKDKLKKLKGKRKKAYNIKNDELTGERLKLGSHFSHIRSKASYPKLSLDIDNGLLINPLTHKKITSLQIEDEEALEKLCREEGWSLDWVDRFREKFC